MFFQFWFMTDVAGLRPDLAGWAIAVGKLWDAVNDPLFGLLADRIRSRLGRRRVLLAVGAVPLGLTFMLMWPVPPLSQTGLAIYYTVTFILFDTAFTAIHVGHNALTPALTQDYDERSSLNGYRMVFNIAGTLGAIILATVLGWYVTDPRALYAGVGVALGLVSIVPPFVVFAITREVDVEAPEAPLRVLEALTATVRNRPFQLVMALYLLSWTAASILSAVLVYVANYYFQAPEQANYLVLSTQTCTILFVPVVVWLARRTDKRRTFVLGSGVWSLMLLGISALRPDQLGLAYVLAGLSGFGIATTYVIPWAMVPDIIEHDEAQTGQRREGSFYAFASFFQKLGTGAALWAMGQALAWSGYVSPAPGGALPVQPASALTALRVFVGPVPAALLLLAMGFAWAYPISREAHRDLLRSLAERDGGGV